MESQEKEMLFRVLEECLHPPKKRPAPEIKKVSLVSPNWRANPNFKPKSLKGSSKRTVAIDCEMVSTEANPNTLARVSIVDFNGGVLLDEYVKTKDKVSNYKTAVSGIKPGHLKFAKSFEEVQAAVLALVSNCTVVGHAISHDLQALDITLPSETVVDTQKLYRHSHGVKNIALRKLCQIELGKVIQEGEHDSIQDARVTMEVYRKLYITEKNSTKEACKEIDSARQKKAGMNLRG